jgi:hypothetical protein
MAETFGRFAAAPIGPLLAARDGGLTLATTSAADLNRMARSDIAQTEGTVGVEFAVWGEDEMAAVVGIVTSSAPLDAYPGATAGGLGWNLAAGRLMINGTAAAVGLPFVSRGDTAGLLVEIGSPNRLKLYRNGELVHQRDFVMAGALYFAAALAATEPGGLNMAVNAGQWGARSPAAAAGWGLAEPAAEVVRISDVDWLTAPGDTPSNARFEGMLAEGINLVSEINFWPWGGEPVSQTSAAECTVLDAEGRLDELAQRGVTGLPVQIRMGSEAGMLNDTVPVFRFSVDRIEINDDGSKTLHFKDAHDDLDGTINRGVFLPNITGLAWKPQPVVIGAVASVPAMGANSDATAMFVADGPVFADVVMDRGDTMEPGTYSVSPDGQQLIMKSPPVSANATQILETRATQLENGQTQLMAQYAFALDVNGRTIGMKALNNGTVGRIDFVADAINIVDPNNTGSTTFEGGRWITRSGGYMQVHGKPFGTTGDLMFYIGVGSDPNAASKGNGIFWIDNKGNAYFGGSLSAGVLRNGVQTGTTQTIGTELVNGPFRTNGNNRTVTLSFVRTHRRQRSAGGSTGWVSGAGSNTAQVQLYRQIGTGGWVLWQVLNVTGSVNISNETDGPDIVDSGWSGSFTVNDSSSPLETVSYRAVVTAFTEQSVAHQSGSFDAQTITQNLSIISVEQ